jgi:unsaturated rhamnogalacturonyl hydrolase
MKMTLSHTAFVFGFVLFSLASVSSESTNAAPQTFSDATPLEWSVRLADSQIVRFKSTPKWDYSVGLFTLSLLKLNTVTNDLQYVIFSEISVGSLISSNGTIQGYKLDEYQLDALNPGKTALALWQIKHDGKYKIAATILRRQLDTQPRTFDGGFWHKQRYTNQMWLDGIYMAEPFYAEYAKLFDESNSFDDVAKQFQLIDEHTYDAKTGLNYHGWDAAKVQPWADTVTGCSSNFWGRAVGWYAMALVDVLDYFPTNHPARPQIIATFQKTCAGIVKWQDSQSGLWWQVMDQGGRRGNYKEATASAMFVYALAKGVNRGYLPRADVAAAEKGFDGIVKNLIQDDGGGKWSLTQCCSVAGLGFTNAAGRPRDGSFDYYVSEPAVKNDLKGVGPFILAGIELQQLTNRQ